MANRKESAADITVSVGEDTEVVVETLSLTKEIDIEEIYGSGKAFPDGYAINQVSFKGSMELMGNRLDLEETLFDDAGIPVEFNITVTHFDGSSTKFKQCLTISDGWEMNQGESTTTSFELIAMDRSRET